MKCREFISIFIILRNEERVVHLVQSQIAAIPEWEPSRALTKGLGSGMAQNKAGAIIEDHVQERRSVK